MKADWRKRVDEYLAAHGAGKPDELEEFGKFLQSRVSVLIGPAGTGKTPPGTATKAFKGLSPIPNTSMGL
jgi:hypothetical protein